MSDYDEQRERYMNREINHHDFYMWVAGRLGIGWTDTKYMGRTLERWRELYSKDEHLNNVSLQKFDMLYPYSRNAARRLGWQGWSYADNVCVHKTVIADKVTK